MTDGLTALGIACLIVWGGLWFYLFSLQRRLDTLEDERHEAQGEEHVVSGPKPSR